MIECEIKVRIPSREKMKQQLLELGFEKLYTLQETDTYFDDNKGSLRAGDSALRIRRVVYLDTGEKRTQITLKGKKMDPATMTRPEFETSVEQAEVMQHILEALGYAPVEPKVIKTRQELARGDMHACLDTVEGLGDFLELEIMVLTQKEQETARQQMEAVLQQVGFTMGDTTRISYLSQLMHRKD